MRSWQEGFFLLSSVSWGIHRLNHKECRKHLDPGNLEFQARPITPSQIKDNHHQPCAQRVPAGLQILPCSWPNRFTANEESGSGAPSRLPVPSEQMEEPWELRATERWAFPLSWLDFYSHTHESVWETASRKSSKNWYSDPKQEHVSHYWQHRQCLGVRVALCIHTPLSPFLLLFPEPTWVQCWKAWHFK